MEGQQLGSYRIERKLGEGGMGVVYVGVDVRLGRRAAVKQLLPSMSGDRTMVERFFNEAKAAASINHPGIVEIYDVGWHADGSAYFAMKLLEGDSLAARLRARGPMPVQLAATIARQIASALGAAHARGIVHRDLKPDNIVLVADEEVAIGERATVLDFGIAKLFGDQPLTSRTRTGSVMGTPYYMSPEQCRGSGEIDHRTDVYALGCLLFEMLAGRPPFVAEGAGEILGLHQFVEPPAVRQFRADVPAELEALVMRMLAKRVEQRPQTMAELTAALQPFATQAVRVHEAVARVPYPPAPGSYPPAVAPHPSTIGGSSGQVGASPPPPRSRRGLVMGLVGAGVAAAVVVAVLAMGGGDEPTASAAISIDAGATPPPPPPPSIDAAAAIDPPPPPPAIDAGTAVVTPPGDAPPTRRTPPKRTGDRTGDATTVTTGDAPIPQPKPPRPPPDPGADPATLAAEAAKAGGTGQWARALALAEASLRAGARGADRERAISVAALAGCSLKNEAKARQYYGLMAGGRKPLIRQRCLASGLELESSGGY